MPWAGGGAGGGIDPIVIRQVKADSTSNQFVLDVTGIPADYDLHLLIKTQQTTGTAGNNTLTFNALAGTNYRQATWRKVSTGGTSSSANDGATQAFISLGVISDTAGVNAWSWGSFKIPVGWKDAAVETAIFGEAWVDDAASFNGARTMQGGSLNVTNVVTSIEVNTNQGNFLIGSEVQITAVPRGLLG